MIDIPPFSDYFASPIGTLLIKASEKGLVGVEMVNALNAEIKSSVVIRNTVTQLEQYFNKERKNFDIPLDLSGVTIFQRHIYRLLLEIPYGTTITYAQLSKLYGDIKAIRAVATANAKNPVPVIIPCHRVIGSDGTLRGFRLGLDAKQDLLRLENPDKYTQQCLLDFNQEDL